MNLQMAIGQIASRMTDRDSSYAIAVPLTASYIKALRTFRGSRAFEQLDLGLYLVQRNEEIRPLAADDISGWIESCDLHNLGRNSATPSRPYDDEGAQLGHEDEPPVEDTPFLRA